jgi:translation elongation factor EF-G
MIICSRLLSEEAHEFIRPAKQPCPSRNQCCEKKVDIIVTTNELQQEIADLSQILIDIQKKVNDIQKQEIVELSNYVEGNKGSIIQSASKKERVCVYQKDTALQSALDSAQKQISISKKNIEKSALLITTNE